MKFLRLVAAIVLSGLGLYWIIVGLGAFFLSFAVLPPGSRSDFEPWVLALLGVGTFVLGVICVLAGIYLFKDTSE